MHYQWIVRYNYDELPTLVTSTEFLNVICSTIQSMNVCEGNRDDRQKKPSLFHSS